MLGIILNNLDKYPLDYVVHYELEIDWAWSNKVIDLMEEKCKKAGIKFIRIKPRRTWQELYEKYDMPTRRCRWCNSDYKLDAEKQMISWIESQGCRPVAYIGFCADETRRFKYQLGNWEKGNICYPLAEEGICESEVLSWARTQPIFMDWYKYFLRQGCRYCPNLSMKEIAFMCKYEPESFEFFFKCIKEYEEKYNTFYWSGACSDVIKKRVENKWVSILEMEESQISIFDLMNVG